jgi:hypothetical protein
MSKVLMPVLVLSFLCGCEENTAPTRPRTLEDAHRLPQQIVELEFEKLPNLHPYAYLADEAYEPLDADSIEMWSYRGDLYYHPVYLLGRALTFFGQYLLTDDAVYLNRAVRHYEKVLSLGHRQGDAIFYPNTFTYAVHGDSAYAFYPPWYSGMAQGYAVTLACRLHAVTGESRYLHEADSSFNALLRLDPETGPTVARIDEAGFYWIEEYPHREYPGMTLNGFVYAVQGVYEYYLQRRSEAARLVLECSITTLKHYLPRYRQPGMLSLYCLGHRRPAGKAYHVLHMQQMQQLKTMTGDRFFDIMVSQFEADLGESPWPSRPSSRESP